MLKSHLTLPAAAVFSPAISRSARSSLCRASFSPWRGMPHAHAHRHCHMHTYRNSCMAYRRKRIADVTRRFTAGSTGRRIAFLPRAARRWRSARLRVMTVGVKIGNGVALRGALAWRLAACRQPLFGLPLPLAFTWLCAAASWQQQLGTEGRSETHPTPTCPHLRCLTLPSALPALQIFREKKREREA